MKFRFLWICSALILRSYGASISSSLEPPIKSSHQLDPNVLPAASASEDPLRVENYDNSALLSKEEPKPFDVDSKVGVFSNGKASEGGLASADSENSPPFEWNHHETDTEKKICGASTLGFCEDPSSDYCSDNLGFSDNSPSPEDSDSSDSSESPDYSNMIFYLGDDPQEYHEMSPCDVSHQPGKGSDFKDGNMCKSSKAVSDHYVPFCDYLVSGYTSIGKTNLFPGYVFMGENGICMSCSTANRAEKDNTCPEYINAYATSEALDGKSDTFEEAEEIKTQNTLRETNVQTVGKEKLKFLADLGSSFLYKNGKSHSQCNSFITWSKYGESLAFGIAGGEAQYSSYGGYNPLSQTLCGIASALFREKAPGGWRAKELMLQAYKKSLSRYLQLGAFQAIFGVINPGNSLTVVTTGSMWAGLYRDGKIVHITHPSSRPLDRDFLDQGTVANGHDDADIYHEKNLIEMWRSLHEYKWKVFPGDQLVFLTKSVKDALSPSHVQETVENSSISDIPMIQLALKLAVSAESCDKSRTTDNFDDPSVSEYGVIAMKVLEDFKDGPLLGTRMR